MIHNGYAEYVVLKGCMRGHALSTVWHWLDLRVRKQVGITGSVQRAMLATLRSAIRLSKDPLRWSIVDRRIHVRLRSTPAPYRCGPQLLLFAPWAAVYAGVEAARGDGGPMFCGQASTTLVGSSITAVRSSSGHLHWRHV